MKVDTTQAREIAANCEDGWATRIVTLTVPALCDRVEEFERVLRAVLDDFPGARRMPESVEAARVALGGGE